MNDEPDENSAPELTADEEALLQEMPALADLGVTRRSFVKQVGVLREVRGRQRGLYQR
jgi:hypothetical protein